MTRQTRQRLTRIAPFQAGIVLGAVYGFAGLLTIPVTFITVSNQSIASAIGFAVIAPLFISLAGFLSGVLLTGLYNLVAGWTGGIEIELSEHPSDAAGSF